VRGKQAKSVTNFVTLCSWYSGIKPTVILTEIFHPNIAFKHRIQTSYSNIVFKHRIQTSYPKTIMRTLIQHGLLVLLGIAATDSRAEIEWMCNKIAGLRIFADADGKMNLSVRDILNGGVLIVSQFTLYADAQKGFRPSYTQAATPNVAEPLYDLFVGHFRHTVIGSDIAVATGVFGAMMDVELVNDGPVTIWLEKEAKPLVK
jgi:D-aminoacyl-tRNA deacylase